MRYKLRTLLVLLAILPPLLAGAWFAWQSYQAELARREALRVQKIDRAKRSLFTTSFIPAASAPVELPAGTIAIPAPLEAAQP